MRVLIKVLLFPISLILTIVIAIGSFLVGKCTFVLNILSVLFTIGAVLCFLEYFFGWPFTDPGVAWDWKMGVTSLVIAFIFSPYGLPAVLTWFIERLDDLNDAIKTI